jgi:hypothetical protein
MIVKHSFADQSEAWYMSADDYLSKAILAVEERRGEKLHKQYTSPLPPNSTPSLINTMFLL